MTASARVQSWPVELRFNAAQRVLKVTFDDGYAASIPFELLRVESPSAETQGHGGSTRPPPPARARSVTVKGADPVGRYAVRIRFSDGHDTGLYSWPCLRRIAEQGPALMDAYLRRLAEAGLSRD